MRATVMYGAGDVRVENVPDAGLKESTDALIVVTRAAICGSDLWPYKGMPASEVGRRMGHEFIGIVEAVGKDVHKIKVGDLVAAPFAWSDGTCEFCQQGLHTSCLHGGWWGGTELDGGQGEAVRVPQAYGTLYPLPVNRDHALMPSLLTLTDVMATGHHAAVTAKVSPGKIAAVVGGCAVLLQRKDSVQSKSSFWIVMPTALRLPKNLARPISSTSAGMPQLNGCWLSPTGWALIRSWNVLATKNRLVPR